MKKFYGIGIATRKVGYSTTFPYIILDEYKELYYGV